MECLHRTRGTFFLTNVTTFQYGGHDELEGRHTVRYDFKVPRLSSLYRLRSGNDAATVATKGSFWFDAGSLELVRLDQIADDIPAGLELAGAITRIQYASLPDAVPIILVPRTAEIELRHPSGEVRRNKIQFAQCREYRAESSISFDSPGPATGASPAELARVDLPAGLKIKMELQEGFDSATAAIGDAVRMRVVEAVRWSGKPVLPKGAMVNGRIRSMQRQARGEGFLLGIELTGTQWGNGRADIRAELLEASGAELNNRTGAQGSSANVVPFSGSSPTMEDTAPERSVTASRTTSGIRGVGMLFVKGERWRLDSGLRMVWRPVGP